MEAALFLEKYAKSVSVMTVNEALSGDAVMKKGIERSDVIRVIGLAKATKILGDDFVTGLEYESTDGKRTLLHVQGVFVEVGLVPVCDFTELVKKNKKGEIEVTIIEE